MTAAKEIERYLKEAYGMDLATHEQMSNEDTDYTSVALNAKNAGTDCVIYWGLNQANGQLCYTAMHQYCGDDIFVIDFLPRIPCGRQNRTITRITNENTSLYAVEIYRLHSDSTIPSSTLPSIAPGRLPKPPMTAAVIALLPNVVPMEYFTE